MVIPYAALTYHHTSNPNILKIVDILQAKDQIWQIHNHANHLQQLAESGHKDLLKTQLQSFFLHESKQDLAVKVHHFVFTMTQYEK